MKTCFTIATLSLGAATCRAQSCSPYWAGPGRPSNPAFINRLVTFDDGTGEALYATGSFWNAGQTARDDAVWRLRNGSWSPVGPGQLIGYGGSLRVLDDGSGPELFAVVSPSTGVWWCRRWDGQAWLEPPPGFFAASSAPGAIFVGPVYSGNGPDGPAIYGTRSNSNPSTFSQVVRWVGGEWLNIGSLAAGTTPRLFEIYDAGSGPRLYAIGTGAGIGGTPTQGIGAWDGQQWHAVSSGGPFYGLVRALCVFDDGSGPKLYMGGDPGSAPPFSQCIVRWDGTQWSSVGGGVVAPSGGFSAQVRALAVFDDGSGPALFAAGYFTSAGGVAADGFARWDGKNWSAVGGRLGSYVETMAVYEDVRGPSLFVGGNFITVNGAHSPRIGQYVGCPNCYANCDLSTTAPKLNIADFTCFLRHFAASSPYANCDNSTGTPALDIADFQCFMQKFAAGCP
jgi:trimeric autotransporter adhesin